MREFLELLHEGGDEGQHRSEALREFVYKIIKEFAEENQKYYQESNLVDLMNKVVNDRRGDIFDEPEQPMSSAAGEMSGRSAGRSKAPAPNSLFGGKRGSK